MAAYYNENDAFAAAWLRELIAAGHIAGGDVDERDIRDVRAADLGGYTQHHWFGGIGGWSRALRLAGIADDWPCWTGSCPCQPFSTAGKGGGFDDERHLWPDWHWLIQQCKPPIVFGEQVDAGIRWGWLDLVFADLETLGYAVGAAVLPAASVGAPHRRDRLWFVADAMQPTGERRAESVLGTQTAVDSARLINGRIADGLADGREADGSLAHADGRDASPEGLQRGGEHGQREEDGGAGLVGNATSDGRIERWSAPSERGAVGGRRSFWSDAIWLPCTDGKARPTQPAIQPLAHGVPRRVGQLRGAGNAIVPQTAAAFIRAYLDARSGSLGPLV